MTDGPGESASAGSDQPEATGRWWSPPRLRRSRPAPRAHFFWRFVYPAIVCAAAVAILVLFIVGGRTVLDRPVDDANTPVELQPDEPGYLELVDSTPTLLGLHTHHGDLVGVTFMALTGIDAGGGVVLLSSDLFVASPDDADSEGEFLGAAYSEGGASAVRRLAESLFGLGFDEVVEIPTGVLALSIEPAAPLPYLILDDLVEVDPGGAARVVYAAGRTSLAAADAAAVYAIRNPDEADVNRLERQKAVWESWFGAIRQAGDPGSAVLSPADAVFPALRELSDFLRALSADTTVVEIPEMQAVALDPGSPPFYVLDDDGRSRLRDRSLELVPWPTQPQSFWRPRVQLLDGTGQLLDEAGDPSAEDALAAEMDALVADVVAAGGVVTVIGTAPEFGVESTRFAYHRPELVTHPVVNTIAYDLGVDMALAEPREGAPDLVVDITVTVGLDRLAQ